MFSSPNSFGFVASGIPRGILFSRVLIPFFYSWRFWPLLKKFMDTGKVQAVSVIGPFSAKSGVFWDYFLHGMACAPHLPWVPIPVWEAGVSSRWWHSLPKMPPTAGGRVLRALFRKESHGWDYDCLLFLSRISGPVHVPASVFFGANFAEVSDELAGRCVVWDDLLWDDEVDFVPESFAGHPPAVWVSPRVLSLKWEEVTPEWCRFRSTYSFREASGHHSIGYPVGLSFAWWGLSRPSRGFESTVSSIQLPFLVRLGAFLSLWLGIVWILMDILGISISVFSK